jgi:urea carboxylase
VVGVLPGPHADPDYLTTDAMDTFYSSPYGVHYNSNRCAGGSASKPPAGHCVRVRVLLRAIERPPRQLLSTRAACRRLGIRFNGPKPTFARADGGEGGSHPSNVHDHIYAIGAVNFTGDMPIVLAQDGPSLGGFVCPATIVSTEMWKMGQVRGKGGWREGEREG